MTYCLDSWAVVAWLDNQRPAADRFDEVIDTRPVMSWVNLGEVYYTVARRSSHERARALIDDLRLRVRPVEVTRKRAIAAAAIKADNPMAFGDAFVVATAIEHDAVLLTGDPEIIDAGGDWAIEDLR